MRTAQAPLWPEMELGMGSFGERMQREREMRSISLEEIAEHTKISKRNLTALEAEHFDQLPGGIFNKGFVRAYAKYLGIDEEQAVADYLAADAETQRRKLASLMPANGNGSAAALGPQLVVPPRTEDAKESVSADHAAGFMKAAVALVVVLGVGGFVYKWMKSREPAPVANATVSAAAPSVSGASAAPALPGFESSPKPQTNPDEATLSTVPPELSFVSPQTSSTPAKAFNLSLKAREESWVQVKADGNVLLEGVLAPNSSKSFDADKELVIRLGNASAVELAYNGKPLPQFATSPGKTKTLLFTPQGLSSDIR
jgi:cytoskeleton protein RodZ